MITVLRVNHCWLGFLRYTRMSPSEVAYRHFCHQTHTAIQYLKEVVMMLCIPGAYKSMRPATVKLLESD